MISLKKEFIKLTSTTRLYNCGVPIIGLTGGIATGKSSVSLILESMNFSVICADKIVKEIYRRPESQLFIQHHFPEVVDSTTKQIDFRKLREKVFANVNDLELLENFLHPKIKDYFLASVSSLQQDNKRPPFVIYDVPLLFEKKISSSFDLIITVYASKEIQTKRLMARDSIDLSLAQKIIATQMDIEQKRKLSDFVIDNNSDNPTSKRQTKLATSVQNIVNIITED